MLTKRNTFVKSENHKTQLKAPWVIYASFEAIQGKLKVPHKIQIKKKKKKKPQLHKACGFALRAVRSDGMSIRPIVYRGPDAVKIFLTEVQSLKVLIKQELKNRITQVNLGPVAKFRCTTWLGGPWAAGRRVRGWIFVAKILEQSIVHA